MSGSLLSEFRKALAHAAAARGASFETWRDARPIRENLIAIKSPEPLLLYVKERSSARGFWGVTANRVRQLEGSGLPWYLVLLAGVASSGHVLQARQVRDRISSGEWKLGHDGDYKVNQSGLRLPAEARLESWEQIFGVIL